MKRPTEPRQSVGDIDPDLVSNPVGSRHDLRRARAYLTQLRQATQQSLSGSGSDDRDARVITVDQVYPDGVGRDDRVEIVVQPMRFEVSPDQARTDAPDAPQHLG